MESFYEASRLARINLPPMVAAVAQSLPDLGILVNSAQLLRQLSREREQYEAKKTRAALFAGDLSLSALLLVKG